MNYKLLNKENGIIKDREPQIVFDKLHVSFEGLEDVATAIFERDDGESLYRTLCDNKCMLESRWLKGSIKVTVAIFKNTARTKRWFCEGFFAQPVPNSKCVLIYPADTDLQGKFVELQEKPSDVENKYTLAYANLVPFLIGAIKELNAEIKILKDKLNDNN